MIYDVVIVGAGPCGLATAARLSEKTPSALFTDAEHARYWNRYKKTSTIEKETRRGKRQHGSSNDKVLEQDSAQSSSDGQHRSMLVLDAASDEWLSVWHQRFDGLKIDYLRSPLFFHCDPRDRDALLEYGHAEGRSKELKEISNVVGREASKHQKKRMRKKKLSDKQSDSTRHLDLDNRDQTDYHTPSSLLFHDHCSRLIERYCLSNIIKKAKIISIRYGLTDIATEPGPLFTLTSDTDQIFLARSVVIASGAGISPSIPPDYKFLNPRGSASHIFGKAKSEDIDLLPAHIETKTSSQEPISIAIVGGGLTSLQLTNLLLSQRQNKSATNIKIHLIMRSKLKIKHFDVDLEWVSKLRNRNMAMFWSAETDEERFEMLKQARNGGSVPPEWAKKLKQLEKEGKVTCHESSQIINGSWDEESLSWNLSLQTTTPLHSPSNHERPLTATTKSLNPIHHIFFATGIAPNVTKIDFLQDLAKDHPISSIGGLPVIDNDLKWDCDIPLFVTGALAGLRLGPGAGNLAGARLGAERIAWALDSILDARRDCSSSSSLQQGLGSGMGDVRRGADSAYGSGSDDEAKRNGSGSGNGGQKRAFTDVDRSEFTGGFSNQFEALAC